MGIKKGSSAESYLELRQPLSAYDFRSKGNCCRHRYDPDDLTPTFWCANRRSNAEPRGITSEQWALAKALCEICPVQWDCVIMSIEEKQNHCIWAADEDERKLLRGHENWRELVEEARRAGRSVQAMIATLDTAG